MNILLVYLQPKDLKEVLDPLEKIPVDKLYLKYYPYPDVYKVAYDFIRGHSEYTHIFWLQNDIVLTTEEFNLACFKFSTLQTRILGLSMNVDMTENSNKCAYTTAPINQEHADKIDFPIRGYFEGIIEVFHNGGPFLISRELFLIFPLKGDKSGFNADIIHGKELFENGIRYYLDTSIHLKHLRYMGKMLVHIKKPQMEFIRWQ